MKKQTILIVTIVALLIATSSLVARPGHRGLDWQSFAERHDLDGDGVVTEEELPEGSMILAHLDANEDGVITEDDLATRRFELVSEGLVRMADADRDGQVGSEEWEALEQALDPDGDGAFTADDLHALRSEMGRRHHKGEGRPRGFDGPPLGDSSKRAADLEGILDLDGDDQLTSNDLDLLFVQLDEDGDGMLVVTTRHRKRGRVSKG